MADTVIVNASPLIFLSGAGLLDLFRFDAGAEVLVPEPVWREVTVKGGTASTTLKALNSCTWIRRVQAPVLEETVATWNLGAGESAVIGCALAHPCSTVVIDDLAARRCARSLGLGVRGTLGLVLDGHRRGTVKDARRVLEAMRMRGMWLSDAVFAKALREAGIES